MKIPYLDFIRAREVNFDVIEVEILRTYATLFIAMHKQRVFKIYKPNEHKWQLVKDYDKILLSVKIIPNTFNDSMVKAFDYSFVK